MSGADYLTVVVLAALLILAFVVDRIREMDHRRIQRIEQADEQRRLMREIGRQP